MFKYCFNWKKETNAATKGHRKAMKKLLQQRKQIQLNFLYSLFV